MNNEQCLNKLGRMGVPQPKPGEPYTFLKLLTKERRSPYYGPGLMWRKGSVLEEPDCDDDALEPCGRGLNLLLDEPLPRFVYSGSNNLDEFKHELAYGMHRSQLLKVYVMPEDVVCVPRASKWDRTDKIRVRKLRVGPRVTYGDWAAVILDEGANRSARKQRLLDAKRQERRKVKS